MPKELFSLRLTEGDSVAENIHRCEMRESTEAEALGRLGKKGISEAAETQGVGGASSLRQEEEQLEEQRGRG